jgi:hypothetical protein
MALIKVGSINNSAVGAKETARVQKSFLKGIWIFSALNEVSRERCRHRLSVPFYKPMAMIMQTF